MTFSIAGHCARTGMFGVAITTSPTQLGRSTSMVAGNRRDRAILTSGAVT